MSNVSFNPYTALSQSKLAETAKPAEGGAAAGKAGGVAEGLADFRAAIQEAEQAAINTAVTGADPHAMVEALANAELVLQTAVTIRDKVVEAYQELLRMPV